MEVGAMHGRVSAIQHVRKLRGGSQAHLLKASDGGFYVTKFRNNPQHVKVLSNEMFAGLLAQRLGLPVPKRIVIEVPVGLIKETPSMRIDLCRASFPCSSGNQLGLRYVGCSIDDRVDDYLPEDALRDVTNLGDFARVMVLDKWTVNTDGRQAVFARSSSSSDRYSATFVDQGFCFNAGSWDFPDSALRGAYARNCVYNHVTGWQAFEPALSRAEDLSFEEIWECAEQVPREWYANDIEGLHRISKELYRRRPLIRALITEFRNSSRNPFPNWVANEKQHHCQQITHQRHKLDRLYR
jgi:hypothetical protein